MCAHIKIRHWTPRTTQADDKATADTAASNYQQEGQLRNVVLLNVPVLRVCVSPSWVRATEELLFICASFATAGLEGRDLFSSCTLHRSRHSWSAVVLSHSLESVTHTSDGFLLLFTISSYQCDEYFIFTAILPTYIYVGPCGNYLP